MAIRRDDSHRRIVLEQNRSDEGIKWIGISILFHFHFQPTPVREPTGSCSAPWRIPPAVAVFLPLTSGSERAFDGQVYSPQLTAAAACYSFPFRGTLAEGSSRLAGRTRSGLHCVRFCGEKFSQEVFRKAAREEGIFNDRIRWINIFPPKWGCW